MWPFLFFHAPKIPLVPKLTIGNTFSEDETLESLDQEQHNLRSRSIHKRYSVKSAEVSSFFLTLKCEN